MTLKNIFFLFLLVVGPFSIWANIDLEEFTQDFVLETKKIEIVESVHAFNPSIVRWNGRLLMSFREIAEPCSILNLPSAAESAIGLVWLNEDFTQANPAQVLDLMNTDEVFSEDGRLLVVEGHLYIVYSGFEKKFTIQPEFLVYVAEIGFDGSRFYVIHNECLSNFEGKIKNRREKNWVPYVYNGKLHLAYQLNPHKILCPWLDGTGKCDTTAFTFPSVVWEWGDLRGGTTALSLNEDSYLAFFHSCMPCSTIHSDNEPVLHYFMGAYTFSNKPPFKIQQISPEPIVGKNFYHGKVYEPYWHPVRVVFPCGFMIEKDEIWITYGRQDHECWIVRLDKQGLLDSLIQVSTFKDTSNQK